MNKNMNPIINSPLQNSRLVNLIFESNNHSFFNNTNYDQYLFTDSIIFHPKVSCSTPKPQGKVEIIRSKQYPKCLNQNTNKFLMHRSKIKNSKVVSRKSHLLFAVKQQKKTELCIDKMNTSTYFLGQKERNNLNRFSDKLLSLREPQKKINKSLLQELSSVIQKFKINRPFSGFRSQSCETKRNCEERRKQRNQIKPWDFNKEDDF